MRRVETPIQMHFPTSFQPFLHLPSSQLTIHSIRCCHSWPICRTAWPRGHMYACVQNHGRRCGSANNVVRGHTRIVFGSVLQRMLPLLSHRIKRLSLARRLTFAAGHLPQSTPHLWETVADFANVVCVASTECITSDESRMYAENIRELDPAAFASDSELAMELCGMPRGPHGATGYVLISPVNQCSNCGSNLHVRSDRFSKITVFDDTFGTFTATHYTKYCRKKGCSYQQHYGYHSFGNATEVFYDPSSLSLKYFISSRETAFSTDMLQKFDAEILIGHISYKQRADIYHCYEMRYEVQYINVAIYIIFVN